MIFFKKYRLFFDIVIIIVLGFYAFVQFNRYLGEQGKNFNLVFGSVCVLWSVFKLGRVINYSQSKKGG
jgi:hypothetical protein